MKCLILVLALISTPAFAGEWLDEQSKHVGEATSRMLATPVQPYPSQPYEPRGVETAHPYTYVTPNGDYGNVYLQRRD